MKLSIIIPIYNTEQYILRCLNSIELRDDIELIIIDDSSSDNSVEIVESWLKEKQFPNVTFIKNIENTGVGLTVNKGYDIAKGEYVMTLCDDDYLLEPLSKMINELDGTDLVYYDLRINDGTVFHLDNNTKTNWVGATKFYKKTIIGDTRRTEKRVFGDGDFYFEILKKEPTEKFTNIVFYHYDFPREDSLCGIVRRSYNE